MVNNEDADKTNMQDEEKSEGKPDDKGSDEESPDKEDRKDGNTDQSAAKKDDEDGSVATNGGNSLLGGENGMAESVKKTSIMEKLASQQQKPTKKFLMQGNDGVGDGKDKNILGKKGDKKGAAGAKWKSGGSGGKKKDGGCNNQ